jgi:hypothetical protein
VLDEKKVMWGSGSQSGDGRKILSNNNDPLLSSGTSGNPGRLGISKSYGRITNDFVLFMICYSSIIQALWQCHFWKGLLISPIVDLIRLVL